MSAIVKIFLAVSFVILGLVAWSRHNDWLQNHSASLAFVGAVVALLSFWFSVNVARRNSRRAAVELAARECTKFGTETMPTLAEIQKRLEEAGCEYYQHFRTIADSERLEPDTTLVTSIDKEILKTEELAIRKALNAVESFAIPFCEGVAATDVGFTHCGPAFVWTFDKYFCLFCWSDFEWLYPSTQELYWVWRREIEFVESARAYWRLRRRRDFKNSRDAIAQHYEALKAMFTAGMRLRAERRNRQKQKFLMLPITEQNRKR